MFHNHKFNLVILFVITAIIGWQLFLPGYFSMHDDLQVMRLYEMDQCFQNGQIPCRWSADMGAGYGQPMFTYYSSFPYLVGQLIHQVGIPFVDTAKILFLLCLLATVGFSYLFLTELVSAPAALVGATLYLITPYRAVDIFVRGALSESWALALIPLVLWSIICSIKRPSIKYSIWLAISLGAFLTTHNISSIISLIIFIPFTLVAIKLTKQPITKLKFLIIGGLLGIGLSAFFILPIAFERGLVQTNFLTADYFNFRLHFVAISQLFVSQRWGYGASQPGPDDNLSFSVGIIQTVFMIVLPIILFLKYKHKKQINYFGILFWILGITTIFFTHSKSVYIWDRLPFLAYVQFPWRFLGLVSLCTSVVASASIDSQPRKITNILVPVLIMLVILINFRFFKFERYLPSVNDGTKLTGVEFINQKKSAVSDYLPVASKKIPIDIAPSLPVVPPNSNVNIHYFENRSNYFASEFDVNQDSVVVTFPVVYFPGWHIYHNGTDDHYPISYDNDLGLITVKLDKGYHKIQGFFESTKYMMIGNILTFVSVGSILLLLVTKKNET